MEVTNENAEDTMRLTQADLAVAAFCLAEAFNGYLEAYEAEEYGGDGEVSKEQMEASMNHIRTAFIKFDSLLRSMNPEETNDPEV